MSTVRYFSGQNFLINGLSRLNLYFDNDQKGVCAGAAQKALEYYLLDDLSILNVKLRLLHENNEQYEQLKATPKPNDGILYQQLNHKLHTLSNQEFFLGLRIYQTFPLFRQAFGQTIGQNKIEELSKVVATPEISARGGLHEVFLFLNFLDPRKLGHLLFLIEHYATDFKLGFSVVCNGHQLDIGYDPKAKSWTFMDPNKFPPHEINSKLNEQIFNAFTFPNTNTNFDYCFTIRGLVLGNQKVKALELFARMKKNPLFDSLLKIDSNNILLTDIRGNQILHIAAIQNCPAVLRTLLQFFGVHPDSLNQTRESALQLATQCGNLACVEVLLSDSRTDIHLFSPFGATPLYEAAKENYFRIVKILLEHGADPYLTSSNLHSPLAIAVVNNCKESLQAFIEMGADFTKRDSFGKTPLAYAYEVNTSMIPTIIRHLPSTNPRATRHRHKRSTKRKHQETTPASADKKKTVLPSKKRKTIENINRTANPSAFFTPAKPQPSEKNAISQYLPNFQLRSREF